MTIQTLVGGERVLLELRRKSMEGLTGACYWECGKWGLSSSLAHGDRVHGVAKGQQNKYFRLKNIFFCPQKC